MIYQSKHQYSPPFWSKNKHLSTIVPATLVKVHKTLNYNRERFSIGADFYEVDIYNKNSESLIILVHGLEGNSDAAYIHRLVEAFEQKDFDIAVFNLRGCAEVNNVLHYYHSGMTSDLADYIENHTDHYEYIYLVGVSVGGNIVLKYLGEKSEEVSSKIKKAFVMSVPCDLGASAQKLARGFSKVYLNRFMRRLKQKVNLKKEKGFSIPNYDKIMWSKNFQEFDDLFTSVHFGFGNAAKYYEQNSSINYIENITIPTLLLSSEDDPFLTSSCYPKEIAERHRFLHLMITKYGGHVGYMEKNQSFFYQKIISEFFFD